MVGKEKIEHTLADETPPIVEVSIDEVSWVVTEFSHDISASHGCGKLIDTPSVTQESPLLELPLVALVDRLEEAVEHTSIDEASRSMKELQNDNHLQLPDEHVFHVGLSMAE